jgi:hypothetical protein
MLFSRSPKRLFGRALETAAVIVTDSLGFQGSRVYAFYDPWTRKGRSFVSFRNSSGNWRIAQNSPAEVHYAPKKTQNKTEQKIIILKPKTSNFKKNLKKRKSMYPLHWLRSSRCRLVQDYDIMRSSASRELELQYSWALLLYLQQRLEASDPTTTQGSSEH